MLESLTTEKYFQCDFNLLYTDGLENCVFMQSHGTYYTFTQRNLSVCLCHCCSTLRSPALKHALHIPSCSAYPKSGNEGVKLFRGFPHCCSKICQAQISRTAAEWLHCLISGLGACGMEAVRQYLRHSLEYS